MRKEYLDKIELAKENLIYHEELPDEECEKRFWIAHKAVNELLATKAPNVLEYLLEFFNEENEEYGGFCEHLKSKIGANYSLKQLLNAFYKKFDYLIKNDIEISYEMASWFLYYDMFAEFRKMFNTVKSDKSNEFLDKLFKWCGEKFPSEINLLREDMKKW